MSPAPVLVGGMAFDTTFQRSTQTLSPTINPILLVPFGNRLQLETEFSVSSDITRDQDVWGARQLNKEVAGEWVPTEAS